MEPIITRSATQMTVNIGDKYYKYMEIKVDMETISYKLENLSRR